MHLLEKVYKSRQTLKELLSNEWQTDIIHDVSLKELEIMYSNQANNTYVNSGCNFSLSHLKIPSHKLHVIYYNFPELHRSGTKINKTCCDKLTSLYKKDGFEEEESQFEPEDSILVIINEPVSESIGNSVEQMFLTGIDEISKRELPLPIRKEMKSNKFVVDVNYFRNIHIFHIDTLAINVLNHRLVPRHEVMRNKEDIELVYKQTNSNPTLLPVILRTDPIAKLLRLSPGDMCKISRKSQTSGLSIYYRICK